MKRTATPLLLALSSLTTSADPLIDSWFTERSGQYARIYTSTATESAGTSVTTWSGGQGVQNQPTYAGVHEVASTDTDVYIRTTGLGFHVMGPWYLNEAKTQIFPNFPANQAVIYRIPRDPGTPPTSKTSTGLGAIGYFVDGIAMFDSRDAFSYITASSQDASPVAGIGQGDGVWNRDAYVNEGVTFDAANAHQAGANHHYHANPPGLRHLVGDSVDYDPATNTYTENFNGQHSPILGWVRDGYPVYGPYGYADALDASSGTALMVSGYQKRDGSNGTTNLNTTGRTTLPAWITLQDRSTSITSSQYGPNVSATYTLGHYLEDYAYKGDLGFTQGADFDLDQHNGRYCVTPEDPNGTYAYFVSIEADGTPAFPYNIGATYFGNPTATTATSVPGDATIHFEGGPEATNQLESITIASGSDDVTLVWSAVEGGTYTVEQSSDLNTWNPVDESGTATDGTSTMVTSDPSRADTNPQSFYRSSMTSLAAFDDAGFDYDDGGNGGGDTPGGTFVATFTGPPLPPANVLDNITVGGLGATLVSRDSNTRLTLTVGTLPAGSYPAIVMFSPPNGGTITLTSTNQFTAE